DPGQPGGRIARDGGVEELLDGGRDVGLAGRGGAGGAPEDGVAVAFRPDDDALHRRAGGLRKPDGAARVGDLERADAADESAIASRGLALAGEPVDQALELAGLGVVQQMLVEAEVADEEEGPGGLDGRDPRL